MKTSMPIYRLIGAVLVTCGILGYFTVADELRHTGEFIGVSGVLLAGIILMMVDSRIKFLENLAIQWIAFGLLAGIPIGGIVLDNMLLGVGLGIVAGVILAFMLGKKKASGK